MSNGTSTTDSSTSRQTSGGRTPNEWPLTHLSRIEQRLDDDALVNALLERDREKELGEQILALIGLADGTLEPWENSLWYLIRDYGELRFRLGLVLGAEVAERLAAGRPDLKSIDIGYVTMVLRNWTDGERSRLAESKQANHDPAGHPRWCVTDHEEDTKYGLEKDAGHYSSDRIVGDPRIPDEAVRVCLRSYDGEGPAVPATVEVSQPGTDGAGLSPVDARRLAGLLLIAADDAEGILR